MAYYINKTATNQNIVLSQGIDLSIDFKVEIDVVLLGNFFNGSVFNMSKLWLDIATNGYIKISSAGKTAGNGTFSGGFNNEDVYTLGMKRSGADITASVNSVEIYTVTMSDGGAMLTNDETVTLLDEIPLANLYAFRYYDENNVLIHNYDPSLSNGTGTILIDSVGDNNGTLVNFPTDDSQWVFYDDGGGASGTGPFDFVGVINSLATLTGSMSKDIDYSAAILGSGSVVGVSYKSMDVDGALNLNGSVSGTVNKTALVAGSVQGTYSSTSNMFKSTAVDGALTGSFSLSGFFSLDDVVAFNFSGTTSALFSIAGTANKSIDTEGVAMFSSIVNGVASKTSLLLGDIAIATSMTAAFIKSAFFAGELNSSLTLSGLFFNASNVVDPTFQTIPGKLNVRLSIDGSAVELKTIDGKVYTPVINGII